MSEQTKMYLLTTEMEEHICDNLCRFPREMEQEELDEHCCECKIGQFICDILNEYNRINDFEKSQCYKLLQKIANLEKRLPQFNIGDAAYLVDFEAGVIDASVINGIVCRMDDNGSEFEYDSDLLEFHSNDVGVIAFRSYEEALEALERRKLQNGEA